MEILRHPDLAMQAQAKIYRLFLSKYNQFVITRTEVYMLSVIQTDIRRDSCLLTTDRMGKVAFEVVNHVTPFLSLNLNKISE